MKSFWSFLSIHCFGDNELHNPSSWSFSLLRLFLSNLLFWFLVWPGLNFFKCFSLINHFGLCMNIFNDFWDVLPQDIDSNFKEQIHISYKLHISASDWDLGMLFIESYKLSCSIILIWYRNQRKMNFILSMHFFFLISLKYCCQHLSLVLERTY